MLKYLLFKVILLVYYNMVTFSIYIHLEEFMWFSEIVTFPLSHESGIKSFS